MSLDPYKATVTRIKLCLAACYGIPNHQLELGMLRKLVKPLPWPTVKPKEYERLVHRGNSRA